MNTNEEQFKELHKALVALKDEVITSIQTQQQTFELPLTEAKVLEMLEVSPKTLRKYRNEGILAYSQIGNKYFYKMSDIERMLNQAYVKAYNLN